MKFNKWKEQKESMDAMDSGRSESGQNIIEQPYLEKLQESALNIIQPVMERSMVLAAEYADACGRNVILSEDMEYAMKYCAMNEVGKKIGSLFPEIYDEWLEIAREIEEILERKS